VHELVWIKFNESKCRLKQRKICILIFVIVKRSDETGHITVMKTTKRKDTGASCGCENLKKNCTNFLFHPWFLIIVVFLRFFLICMTMPDIIHKYKSVSILLISWGYLKQRDLTFSQRCCWRYTVSEKWHPCLWASSSKFPQNYRVAMKLRDIEMGFSWFTVERSRWTHRAFLWYLQLPTYSTAFPPI
jgi:hypothetical protein